MIVRVLSAATYGSSEIDASREINDAYAHFLDIHFDILDLSQGMQLTFFFQPISILSFLPFLNDFANICRGYRSLGKCSEKI